MHDFAVFILSHGRPSKVITATTLKRQGYTGSIFIVVDNEDRHIDDYRKIYGDSVVVFDKKKMADSIDEGNNFDERGCIIHARNACFEIAKSIGVKYFMQLDDDYTSFRWRYADQYITKGNVWNLDKLFSLLLAFYKKTKCTSIAIAQGGDFISGEGCRLLNNYKNRARKCMNTFICSTDRPFQFVGQMNEDVNTYTTLATRGHLFLTLPYVGVEQKQTQSQSGGITDLYLKYGTYCKSFTSVIMSPSSVKVFMMGFKEQRLHHRVEWKTTTPQILSEKCKKL